MESISKSQIEEKLLTLCGSQLEPQGYRIVDLDCRVGGRSLLRIYIERQPGASAESGERGAVSLSDCVTVSRALGEFLESCSEIPGAFDLEVSSPGLDRRLRLRSDFESNKGCQVSLKLVEKLEGVGGQIKGDLLEADPAGVLIGSSGQEVAIPWQKIKQANRIWKME